MKKVYICSCPVNPISVYCSDKITSEDISDFIKQIPEDKIPDPIEIVIQRLEKSLNESNKLIGEWDNRKRFGKGDRKRNKSNFKYQFKR
jgi:hypothetical protein